VTHRCGNFVLFHIHILTKACLFWKFWIRIINFLTLLTTYSPKFYYICCCLLLSVAVQFLLPYFIFSNY
jgi:hypothetical protein